MTTKRTQQESESEILSIGEAARLLNAPVKTVRQWTDTGKLGCIRISSGQRLYTRIAVERFLQRRRQLEEL